MTEQHDIVRRGDSFEIGNNIESPSGAGNPAAKGGMFQELINNPSSLTKGLHLTSKQADNVRAILIGAGAGLSNKYLRKHIGDELSAAIGAFGSAYILKRLLGEVPPDNPNQQNQQ